MLKVKRFLKDTICVIFSISLFMCVFYERRSNGRNVFLYSDDNFKGNLHTQRRKPQITVSKKVNS